jgi:hypothetical protein
MEGLTMANDPQTGPPLAEDLHDTDDFPEGYALPDQSPVPDLDPEDLP